MVSKINCKFAWGWYPDVLTPYVLLDTYSLPNDEFTTDGLEDLQTSPVPESTSGDELSTADLLDQTSTRPTQDPDTEEFTTEALGVFSQTHGEGTQASDNLSTPHPTAAEATPERTGGWHWGIMWQ